MAFSRRSDASRRPKTHTNRRQYCCKRRRGIFRARFLLVATLLAVVMTPVVTTTNVQEHIISDASKDSYVSGSQLLLWWGQRGDVDHAMELLGGVQQCPEVVNTRVDSEFLEDAILISCRQDAAGYDVTELLHASEEVVTLSREQTTRLCRSAACAAWLSQVMEATWLPECRYRQSQTSVRSLAETLLRIREELMEDGAVTAPNASLFRELYQLNQLRNLLSVKDEDDVLKNLGTPIMQVARRLEALDDFSLMGSGDSPELSAAVEPTDSTSETGSATGSDGNSASTSSSSTGSNSGSSSSSNRSGSGSSSNSVGDYFPEGSNNSSDTVGFTGSGLGPHAGSTATTTELTPSYAYVVGAWVLFNGSYFFLMRRK